MIEVGTALVLVGFGAFLTLIGIFCGVLVHNRWIDRKLAPKKPMVVIAHTQQQQNSIKPPSVQVKP